MKKTFSKRLQELREERGLTVKELAHAAKVPSTLISALQSGQRSIGENNAAKIGRALGLDDTALQNFIYQALDEAKGKVLQENLLYPAQLLNLLAVQLRQAGIHAESICDFSICGDHQKQDVTLLLGNGEKALLTTQLVCE